MLGKQIAVPNSFALLNLREMLLKSRSEVSGMLEDIDALINSSINSGLISKVMGDIIECMNLSIRIGRRINCG